MYLASESCRNTSRVIAPRNSMIRSFDISGFSRTRLKSNVTSFSSSRRQVRHVHDDREAVRGASDSGNVPCPSSTGFIVAIAKLNGFNS
jgi:hypothetical protein